jgi:nicotinate-nucleotide pyrophosphorylase (carboxylating)
VVKAHIAIPDEECIQLAVRTALQEDLGTGDINAELIAADQLGSARIITREACVLAGVVYAQAAIDQFAGVQTTWHASDGQMLAANDVLLTLHGPARALLSLERTVLNFLQTLSATATVTARYQALIQHTKARILDTRKTIPGLRLAQKYAVRCGGGMNHRMGLYDAFLLKENHIHAAGSISNAVQKARSLYPDRFLQVEVENLAQIEECLALKVQRVLLDNFTPAQTKEIVDKVSGRMELESSGGIDDATLVAYAEAGVDFISIGSLTKHVRAIDLSMRFFS